MIDQDDIKRDEQVFGANGDQALQDIADRKRVQTHEDIPEIPEGIEVSNSAGSEEPDEGDDFELDDYSDVDVDITIEEDI